MHVLADATADPANQWTVLVAVVTSLGAVAAAVLDRVTRRRRDDAEADGLEQIEQYIIAPLRTELDEARRDLAAARSEVGKLRRDLDEIRRELEAARARAEGLQMLLRQAQGGLA